MKVSTLIATAGLASTGLAGLIGGDCMSLVVSNQVLSLTFCSCAQETTQRPTRCNRDTYDYILPNHSLG